MARLVITVARRGPESGDVSRRGRPARLDPEVAHGLRVGPAVLVDRLKRRGEDLARGLLVGRHHRAVRYVIEAALTIVGPPQHQRAADDDAFASEHGAEVLEPGYGPEIRPPGRLQERRVGRRFQEGVSRTPAIFGGRGAGSRGAVAHRSNSKGRRNSSARAASDAFLESTFARSVAPTPKTSRERRDDRRGFR